MEPNDLKKRTKIFAIRIIKLSQRLEKNCGNTGKKIGDQILRSGTGVYANYRAACRCKSAKDFISDVEREKLNNLLFSFRAEELIQV